MKLTNRLGLPEPIVRAVANDGYSRGDADISVTQLIAPPRQVALIEQHRDEIEEDASDRIFSLLGQAVHTILERAGEGMAEERLSTEVNGWKVSGQPDHLALKQGLLSDYKVTSVWQVIYAAQKDEWPAQVNLYAELARRHGHEINAVEIVAIMRDWSKRKALTEADYPREQVAVLPMELWRPSDAQTYLELRVATHQHARKVLPRCSDEEVWRKPLTWAVMKPGVKKALRVLTTLEGAITYQATQVKGLSSIHERPGEATRCQHYCAAAPFCSQWQEEKGSTDEVRTEAVRAEG